jgi:hypothetical protein
MFELTSTQFERGVFELRLEKSYPAPFGWLLRLGPISGRFVALGLIVFATILEFQKQPARLALSQGWIHTQEQARSLQGGVTWAIFGVGLVIYMSVFLFRRESMLLMFDRGQSEFRFLARPISTKARSKEGLLKMEDIRAIRVNGAKRSPQAPHGFIEIEISPLPQLRSGVVRFSVSNDDELKTIAANLSKVVGKDAKGDWVPPADDDPASLGELRDSAPEMNS